MRAVYRGILAVAGFVTGFLTLVFFFQFNRYLSPALAGDQLSLGMAAVYAVMTYAGVAVTVLAFKPSVTVAKYLSGVGGAVTAGFVLSALYLFTFDLASGMMVAIITVGQAVVVGVVYAGAVALAGRSDSESESDTTPPSESESKTAAPNPLQEPSHTETESIENYTDATEPADTTKTGPDTVPPSRRDIDWWGGTQIFAGVAIFLIGIPITIQSPVGVPILLIGLALIPRIRGWSMETLGRSSTES